MNAIKKKKMATYLLIAQIGIYVFILLHSILWYVLDVHVLTKLCPFVFREQLGALQFNLNILFWLLIICSTLFLGRAFCAWGCMFGAYQDFLARLAKKLKIKPVGPKVRKWILRGIVIFLLAAYVIANTMYWPDLLLFSAAVVIAGILLWLLVERKNPDRSKLMISKYIFFSMFIGGIFASWISLNVFHKGVTFVFDKYSVFYEMQIGMALIALLVAVGVMVGEKRFFCRYLCPVGLSLRFLSAIPFPVKYKVSAAGDGCVQCGKCNKECFMMQKPMEEVNDHKIVKSPDCINCMACVSACPKNVLDFTNVKSPEANGAKSPEHDRTPADGLS